MTRNCFKACWMVIYRLGETCRFSNLYNFYFQSDALQMPPGNWAWERMCLDDMLFQLFRLIEIGIL